MFALLASALLSLPAVSSASVTCADRPASCDGAWGLRAAPSAGDDGAGPRDYATPAEIECPTPAPAMAGPMLSGECDQTPPDLWYRVSRVPTGAPAGALAIDHRPSLSRFASSCGAPPATPKHAATPDTQPLALVAVPALLADAADIDFPFDAQAPPGRCLVPPDRPPRG